MKGRRAVTPAAAAERLAKLLEEGARFHRRGQFDRALVNYAEVIRHAPGHAKAHHLLGLALLGRKKPGDVDSSIQFLSRAVSLDDRQAAFYNDLGNAYWSKRRIEEALSAFLSAVELDPDFVQPHFNLGNCYWLLGRYAEALAEYRRTIELNPGWAQAHYMMGNCLLYLGYTRDSLAPYDKAIEKRQDFTDAYVGKATALLKLGRWRESWPYFARRVDYPELAVFRSSTRPVWRGEFMPESTLLVYGEQGIGDVIQFVRFLPQARARVGRLILVCDARLHNLFDKLDCIDQLVDKGQALEELDSIEFDHRVLLMSLAEIFDVAVDDVPANVPYLEADPALVDVWRQRLDPQTFNVGLVWAGNPAQKDDRFRSCPLSVFAPLGGVAHIKLYSLQTDAARAQIQESNAPPLVDLGDHLTGFHETAAAITALDLVVSVDTAVAHLAGALGRPVWNLLWYGHCWRYLENRETTPWYPSMRLFRQRTTGDWESVITQVADQLSGAALRAANGPEPGDST